MIPRKQGCGPGCAVMAHGEPKTATYHASAQGLMQVPPPVAEASGLGDLRAQANSSGGATDLNTVDY